MILITKQTIHAQHITQHTTTMTQHDLAHPAGGAAFLFMSVSRRRENPRRNIQQHHYDYYYYYYGQY